MPTTRLPDCFRRASAVSTVLLLRRSTAGEQCICTVCLLHWFGSPLPACPRLTPAELLFLRRTVLSIIHSSSDLCSVPLVVCDIPLSAGLSLIPFNNSWSFLSVRRHQTLPAVTRSLCCASIACCSHQITPLCFYSALPSLAELHLLHFTAPVSAVKLFFFCPPTLPRATLWSLLAVLLCY